MHLKIIKINKMNSFNFQHWFQWKYLTNLIKIHEKEVYENYGAKIFADTDVSKNNK